MDSDLFARAGAMFEQKAGERHAASSAWAPPPGDGLLAQLHARVAAEHGQQRQPAPPGLHDFFTAAFDDALRGQNCRVSLG